jgi:hypothetical protein
VQAEGQGKLGRGNRGRGNRGRGTEEGETGFRRQKKSGIDPGGITNRLRAIATTVTVKARAKGFMTNSSS